MHFVAYTCEMLNITILGTGSVGSTLGRRWAQRGHRITFGSRNPNAPKVRDLLSQCDGNASAATNDEAITADTRVVVIATPWPVTLDLVRVLADQLAGKVVVDCTNPLRNDLDGLSIGHDTSAAEQIAAAAPGAKVVKAFNSTGANNMENPKFGEQNDDAFICGDDTHAKNIVTDLAQQLGFDVIDSGALRVARYLEPLAMLWIHLAMHQRLGRDIAIKLLRREKPSQLTPAHSRV